MSVFNFSQRMKVREPSMRLEDGSRIAVVGGGPAGSFFSYFLLDLAERAGIDLEVDIYEPRDFSLPAPQGCNMCAGVISETLIQNLATEGINLPSSIVQKAIDSYVLHTDLGTQQLEAASREKRIGTVYRGGGPKGGREVKCLGLDAFLLSKVMEKGANLIRSRVTGVERAGELVTVRTRTGERDGYSLLVVATGVNTAALKLFEDHSSQYIPPKTAKAALREYRLGKETVDEYFGDALHVFLLDIPNLDFAMIVPKGDFVSLCLLGKDIDDGMIRDFLTAPEVASCFPPGWHWNLPDCHCSPRINIQAAVRPYADRVVFIGDSGVSRLFKDGIGAAYRSAKAAASCAVLEGVSSEDFRRYYAPFCRRVQMDNQLGKFIFSISHIFQHVHFARSAMLRMVAAEQRSPASPPRMSSVLWDTFTGSAPYADVLLRTIQPAFIGHLIWRLAGSIVSG